MEFALVFPILALVLFAIIDFAVAFNDYQSLRQGAREGARQAVVDDPSGGGECPSGTDAEKLICLTKARSEVDGVSVRVFVSDAPDGEDGDPGYRDDKVLVCVAKPVSSLSGFTSPFIGDKVLSSSIEMRAETTLSDGLKTAAAVSAGYGDPAPSGTTWSSLC